jgi:hypothetical protein
VAAHTVTPPPPPSATVDALRRAADALEAYRAAAGGDAVRAVRSLDVVGVSQSSALPGKRSLHIVAVFPTTFQQDEKPPSSETKGVQTIITLTGETGWYGGTGRLAGPLRPVEKPGGSTAETRGARQAFANVFAGMLPTWLFDGQRFTFTDEGTVDAGKDAGGEILSVDGPDGHAGQLILDRVTHMPRRFTSDRSAAAGAAASGMTVLFSDYRPVNGVQLPFRITRESDNGVHVTWTLVHYGINAKVDRKLFIRSVHK